MTGPTRTDGYAPIAGYAALGDGRSVALVAADGQIDWWPVPTLHAPPVCAAIIDPASGGHFSLAPQEAFEVTRRYIGGTNVLESTYSTPSGSARVTEALNVGTAGRLPWTELVRRVDGLSGQLVMGWEFVPGRRFGRARPRITVRGATPVVAIEDQALAVVVHGGPPGQAGEDRVTGTFRTRRGSRTVLTVVATDHEPLFLPAFSDIARRLDHTVEQWRHWTSTIEYRGPWRESVERSALALKTLLYEPSGAVAAAATTSLPERIGGPKNWDYRYAWVRDSSFTLDALIRLGLHEEVHASVSFLLDALRRSEPRLPVFYTLDGEVANTETTLDAPGYRNSRPVRAGNAAARQRQLGNYGDLFDTIWLYVRAGHLLDADSGRLLSSLADQCQQTWLSEDSGIWELDDRHHYTISKIGCWVALDRAARLAAAGQLPAGHAEQWQAEAAAIERWVHHHCWSEAKQAYTFYAGTDDLDAAVLLAARTGFDTGPRLASTIRAVTAELGMTDSPLLYRYSGASNEEGAFVACTFWLVDALCRSGDVDGATRLMDQAVALVNDVGLLSEQIDPTDGAFLGNTPQGLSHLALINAAHAIHDHRSHRHREDHDRTAP